MKTDSEKKLLYNDFEKIKNGFFAGQAYLCSPTYLLAGIFNILLNLNDIKIGFIREYVDILEQ